MDFSIVLADFKLRKKHFFALSYENRYHECPPTIECYKPKVKLTSTFCPFPNGFFRDRSEWEVLNISDTSYLKEVGKMNECLHTMLTNILPSTITTLASTAVQRLKE